MTTAVASLSSRILRRERVRSYYRTSRLGFAVWWCFLLLLHIANVAYYVGVAVLYKRIRFTNLDFQLSIYSIGIGGAEWTKVAAVHLAVAGIHAVCLLNMIVGSLATRRLAFQPDFSRLVRYVCRGRKTTPVGPKPELQPTQLVDKISSTVVASSQAVFGRDGWLGVDHVRFDHFLLAREVVETVLQTIQVYRMSYLLPRMWLIRVYVVLLIANCWSMPALYRYYRDRHVERRMMSLLCDSVLDMVSSIGVSFLIFATYYPQYTDPAFGFPFVNWFDDVWFTNMQQEFRMMLIGSWADLASRLVFALGLLQGMDAMKDFLVPSKDVAPSMASLVPSTNPRGSHKPPSERLIVVPISPGTAKNRWKWMRHRFLHSLHVAIAVLFLLWGFAILIVHGMAEFRTKSDQSVPCQLALHPWLTSRAACSLVELDCYAMGRLTGSCESMETLWTHFEAPATARLVVRNCPQLVMPSTLSQFTRMTGLKVYNSTIQSWAEDAALTEASHAGMRVLYLLRTTLPQGELPSGLWTPQFPRGLRSFMTSATNLRSFPPNLHERWPRNMLVALESSAMTSVPDTLIQLHPTLISFAGSPISVLPPSLFSISSLWCLLIGYTNVHELPRDVSTPAPEWYLFFLQGTNISTFYPWMNRFIDFSLTFHNAFFNAFDTPYCRERARISAGLATGFSAGTNGLASVMNVATPDELRFAETAVDCSPGSPFFIPLLLEDTHSAVH